MHTVKRWLAGRFRIWADRLDYEGAPKRTSWGMTFEDGWGTVFNREGYGCPLWYMGSDIHLAHDVSSITRPGDIEWVTVGMRTPDGVHVLGSAEVAGAETTRRAIGHLTGKLPGARRPARIPQWRITLKCELDSFVSIPGSTYQEAVTAMFGRAGIRG